MDKPRLLIVEDDLDLSEMLNDFFRALDYDVVTAAWGEEAMRISRSTHLDLAILDIRLPDIDGYEVCRRLRSQRQTEGLPIIFLTEKRDRVDRLQGLELGVVDYITKPFDIQELRLRARNAIDRSGRSSHINPVTDMPEREAVQDRLRLLLEQESPWALLQLTIHQLDSIRELYGFVAGDDVMRAVAVMIQNAVREHGSPNDFIGHMGTESFIVITQEDHVEPIRTRLEKRLQQSREYFYPLKDPKKAEEAMEADHLKLSSGVVKGNAGAFETLDALEAAMKAATTKTLNE
jgi:DNA-binding response OmpR family regulator